MTLPHTSFADLAAALREIVEREARTDCQCEQFLARYPNENMALTLRELQRTTARLSEAARLLGALIPIEQEVRALHAAAAAAGVLLRPFGRRNRSERAT